MQKMYFRQQSIQGQSLIEILFAMSLAVVAISTIAYLLLNNQALVRGSLEREQARALAEEGVFAVRAIAHRSFDDVLVGTHGVILQGSVWNFAGKSDTTGKYTRTITVSIVDTDIYSVESVITWKLNSVHDEHISVSSLISNWEQTTGAAGYLSFDVGAIAYMSDGTTITGLSVANASQAGSAVVSLMRLEWEGSAELLSVGLAGDTVFTASTSGTVASGEVFDVMDTPLENTGSPIAVGPLVFSRDVSFVDMLLTVYLQDGSRRSMRILSNP